ncbi:PREDICTED: cytochrome b5 reductase 4-like isoform X2 [Papilio xuthus]|nr:PREDICTED: cytochrome b5 reductase 4-like isoform X2 [Papilio xuthus]XP_013179868.1 PREDICTED: cytochrome b5 reductase 4-like isoform X2 [Papilio xuthus]XP_013179869.1 PREDICTED: cytochrome b5 reductase 4-like isoform X2 [Papilio xuthus]
MSHATEKEQATEETNINSFNMKLTNVLCTTESISDKSDSKPSILLSSESKLSLPSNLGTPTSPLRLSSPLSLPNSPTPFTKTSLQSNAKTDTSRLPSPQQKSNLQTANMNSGSATGNPRNKCALQPGHSLMDWIRLGNSGKDLTGVGGRMRPVHPSELATHNTKNDAWLAIRGRVYNITHYLPYHPGGPKELMRGAGIDATELFDKVHPWVNYDSLLAKCLIGPLRFDRPDAEDLFDNISSSPKSERLREPSKAQELVRKSMENLANCITPVRKKISNKSDENVKSSPPSKIMQSLIHSSDLPVTISRRAASSPVKSEAKSNDDSPPALRFDWIQTSTKLTISVYTGYLANPGACARLIDGELLIEVVTDDWLRSIKILPEQALREPLQLRVFAESGKVEVIAQKAEMEVWKNCGETSLSNAIKMTAARTVECRVEGSGAVSHDTVLLALTPRSGPVVIPIGFHVRIHQTLAGSECIRSYTPVGDKWAAVDVTAPLKLAIKRYELGVLSPMLTSLKIGSYITVSGPYGNFKLQKLKTVRKILLIAAGTGITPMLGLLKFMLSRSNPRCERVTLIFFNKTERDILFRENFEEIMNQDDRFTVTHVLSNASPTWSGRKGRITKELLSEAFDESAFISDDELSSYACLCGPTEFTHAGVDLLKKLGIKEKCIHAFIG